MLVKVGSSVHEMGHEEWRSLLGAFRDLAPKGIFAIEKDGYGELRKDALEGDELTRAVEEWTRNGWHVHANV
jgi:hypothetical protein